MDQNPKNNTAKEQENATNLRGELGIVQKIEQLAQDTSKTGAWQCKIGRRRKERPSPQNLENHIARTHRQEHIRICREKVHGPLRNEEYSNWNTLLDHMEIRTRNTTWGTTACEILQRNRLPLPPEENHAGSKWQNIQERNTIANTPGGK